MDSFLGTEGQGQRSSQTSKVKVKGHNAVRFLNRGLFSSCEENTQFVSYTLFRIGTFQTCRPVTTHSCLAVRQTTRVNMQVKSLIYTTPSFLDTPIHYTYNVV